MSFDPATIPRPTSWAEYAACYAANLDEARDNLERALVRFRQLRRAGNITERPDSRGGFVFADASAAKAYSDVLRWRSDLDHWHARKVQAEQEMRAAAVLDDPRQPVEVERAAPEREPGDDGDVPW